MADTNLIDEENKPEYILPEKLKLERQKWYSQIFVLMEMIKASQNREIAFLMDKAVPKELRRAVRYSVAIKIDYLKSHFGAYNFFNRNFNLYHSIATLKHFPLMSYNLKERRKSPEYQEFDKNFENYVIGYDLFLDFDGGDSPETAFKEMKEVKAMLDGRKVPYFVLASSLKGFHIRIPYEYMPSNDNVRAKLAQIVAFIRKFKLINLIESLDSSVIDAKRLAKLPYSYVGDGSICLPLTDIQIVNFRPDSLLMNNVLKFVHLKNRGLFVRTHGLQFDELKANTKSFIEEYL